jgi:replication factor C small subunit
MLWIEKYRPGSFDKILGQDRIIAHLGTFAQTGSLPHLLLSGPHGTGKTASIDCLSRALYGDFHEENMTCIQTGDLFFLGRKYLEENEKYSHIYRKDESLLVNFKNIIRWHASLRPLDAPFRLLVFEGASALTREAQQGLRRIMERYSGTCRFIFTTSHPGALIPAISSRCLPFFFAPLSDEIVTGQLRNIMKLEAGDKETICNDDLDLITRAAQGDMRKAVMLLQVTLQSGESFDLVRFSQTETNVIANAIYSAISSGDLQSATRRIETLIIEYGLSSGEVLQELKAVFKREYNDPRIAIALGDTDYLLSHCNNEYIQLNALAARIIGEIFI